MAPACEFGLDLEKSWMFASSFELRGVHQSIRGVLDDQGNFLRSALALLYMQQVSSPCRSFFLKFRSSPWMPGLMSVPRRTP